MQQETAHILALQALGWLAGDADRLSGFLAATGAGPADLRARAAEPEFLAAVLDHLLAEESWVTDFCAAHGHPYTAPQAARAVLPGGLPPHWT